jgi:hypothetical protein
MRRCYFALTKRPGARRGQAGHLLEGGETKKRSIRKCHRQLIQRETKHQNEKDVALTMLPFYHHCFYSSVSMGASSASGATLFLSRLLDQIGTTTMVEKTILICNRERVSLLAISSAIGMRSTFLSFRANCLDAKNSNFEYQIVQT